MWTLESTLPNETFPPQRVGHLKNGMPVLVGIPFFIFYFLFFP
jgi:hypothetical protein